MSTHKITALRTGFTNGMDWEAEYEITFDFVAGAGPILYPADNADPGWPAQVELVSVKPVIGVVDAGAFTDLAEKDIRDWAEEWLGTDGFDEALAVVTSDDEAAREYAAELRADR